MRNLGSSNTTRKKSSFPRRLVLDPLLLGFTALPRTLIGRTRLAALPLAAVMFLAALLVVYLAYAGLLYPLRPDTVEYVGAPLTPFSGLEGAWGGPTLAGAWAVHAAVALVLQAVCLLLIRGLGGVIYRWTGEEGP